MTSHKLCTLVFALLVLALPSFAQTEKGQQETSKTSEATSAPKGQEKDKEKVKEKDKGKESVEATLMNMEKQAWEAVKSRDTNSFSNLFASDGLMADSTGFTTRPAFYQTLPDLTISDYTLEEMKVMMIDKDSAIITYKANVKGSYKGKEFPPNPTYVSSVWAKRNGKWVAVYHQETMAQQ